MQLFHIWNRTSTPHEYLVVQALQIWQFSNYHHHFIGILALLLRPSKETFLVSRPIGYWKVHPVHGWFWYLIPHPLIIISSYDVTNNWTEISKKVMSASFSSHTTLSLMILTGLWSLWTPTAWEMWLLKHLEPLFAGLLILCMNK